MDYEFESVNYDNMSANFLRSASNDFTLIKVGLNFSEEETEMRTSSPKVTAYVSLKSIYLLLDHNKNLIASSLTMEQVKPLSERIKGSIIKFDRMVNAAGV